VKWSLLSSEPREFLQIDTDVAEYLPHKSPPDVLTFVDGDDRGPSVGVLPKCVAPLLSDQGKSQMQEDCL
jgi:hypothetical protein